ncbi:MAG: phosphoribosylglycinamide formyltransferase [Candidatus Micrarchaeia archaeon]
MKKIGIAVLSSGNGSNFQAIIDACASGEINAEIKLFITDNKDSKSLVRAKENSIPYKTVNPEEYPKREEMDLKIKQFLDGAKIDLVVLAGYMRIIKSKELLDSYKYKIINIHPSLLPSFKGSTHAQKDAFDYGCKISGLTIHFVTDDIDGGQIIFQRPVDISDCSSAKKAAGKILKIEHKYYKQVINSFSKGKYIIDGRKTKFIEVK